MTLLLVTPRAASPFVGGRVPREPGPHLLTSLDRTSNSRQLCERDGHLLPGSLRRVELSAETMDDNTGYTLAVQP